MPRSLAYSPEIRSGWKDRRKKEGEEGKEREGSKESASI
jgi:hypothetical protein